MKKYKYKKLQLNNNWLCKLFFIFLIFFIVKRHEQLVDLALRNIIIIIIIITSGTGIKAIYNLIVIMEKW